MSFASFRQKKSTQAEGPHQQHLEAVRVDPISIAGRTASAFIARGEIPQRFRTLGHCRNVAMGRRPRNKNVIHRTTRFEPLLVEQANPPMNLFSVRNDRFHAWRLSGLQDE